MKKKLFLVFSLILCVFLASCRGNDPVVKLTDNAATEVAEQLNLEALKNGTSINKNLDRTEKNYIDVILPAEPAKSLVVRNVNMDAAFGENKVKSVNAVALTFVTGISSEYKTAIISEVYNSDYGITKEKLGLSVDLLKANTFSVKVPSEKGLQYFNEGKTNITLSVIYLPTRVVVVNEKQTVADITVLVPVYAEFNLGEVSDVFKPYKVIEITLDEDGSLPNKQD